MSLPSQYYTVAELQAAPLGLSLKDIPAAKATGPNTPTGLQVYEGLTTLIKSASSAADSYCRQIITATQNTETALTEMMKAWIDREGMLWFKTENYPIVAVSQFRYSSPNQSGGINWIDAPSLDGLVYQGKTQVGAPVWLPRRGLSRLQVQVTYVNGYANTFLTGSDPILAGASTLPVQDLTGFMPGQSFTVYDLGNTETLVVSSTFQPPTLSGEGQATPGDLTLALPTQFDHTPIPRTAVTGTTQPYDVRVSAVPHDFSWAVALICKFFIQERGTGAIVMGAVGGVRGPQPMRISADEIPAEAQFILDNYAARV